MQGAGWSPITHPFATLTAKRTWPIPFDLHVLSTPPAFVLSQDQTLHKKLQRAQNRLEKNTLTKSANKNPTNQKLVSQDTTNMSDTLLDSQLSDPHPVDLAFQLSPQGEQLL